MSIEMRASLTDEQVEIVAEVASLFATMERVVRESPFNRDQAIGAKGVFRSLLVLLAERYGGPFTDAYEYDLSRHRTEAI